MTRFFTTLIKENFNEPPDYIEPFAGGGSLALSLLFGGAVRSIWLNDLNPAIWAFWHSILRQPDEFLEKVETASLTLENWERQREIYNQGLEADPLALGFATFFLNRTNRSGILNAGVIGGKKQDGQWRLDARFNRSDLTRRLKRVAGWADSIRLTRLDAIDLLNNLHGFESGLIYLDPPYVEAGARLYFNQYDIADHRRLNEAVRRVSSHWVISYDDCAVVREFYSSFQAHRFPCSYSATKRRRAQEAVYFSHGLTVTTNISVNSCNRSPPASG